MSRVPHVFAEPALQLRVDLSDGPSPSDAPSDDALRAAIDAMHQLEAGAIANEDEQRQVGHYWLRDPGRAPSEGQRQLIRGIWKQLSQGPLVPDSWTTAVLVGIGGSALGPQMLRAALSHPSDSRRLLSLDNTDPEGIARVLSTVDPATTVVVVVSKSGGTTETRNGLAAVRTVYSQAGVPFGPHAIAITGPGSRLDNLARDPADPWAHVFPITDWVGGRTSITGPVGLVPMALCGWDWRAFLAGACELDNLTRRAEPEQNPAALLARAWFAAGGGRGDRALVVLPYRDRFALLGRYLQQLVMESLGKHLNRQGEVVEQGLTVYGNKGSTDQHAYVQQVRDGRDDTFVHFIDTLAQGPRIDVGDGVFADDHLIGFLLGTRAALRERGRPSVTLRVADASARSLGQLVALFERAVGIYAELININAYHQPGVEAGKRGAKVALSLLAQLESRLDDTARSLDELVPEGAHVATAWRLLDHLAATGRARCEPHTSDPQLDRWRSP